MRRKFHPRGGNLVSAGHSYLAHSGNYQRPAGTNARSGTVHVHCNGDFHVHGELVRMSSAPKPYGEKSDTAELRTTDWLWDDKHHGALYRSPDAADAKHLRGCGAEHGEHEDLWNQLC